MANIPGINAAILSEGTVAKPIAIADNTIPINPKALIRVEEILLSILLSFLKLSFNNDDIRSKYDASQSNFSFQ